MSNPVDLRFWRTATTAPGAVELRFGNPPESGADTGTLAAGLPAPALPTLALSAVGVQRVVVDATLAAGLPAPTLPVLTFAAEQHVERTEGDLAAALPPATLPALSLLSAAVDYDQALPDAVGPGLAARAQQGATLAPPALLARQQAMRPARTPAAARTQQAAPLATGQRAAQQQMLPASRASAQRAQQGLPLGNGSALGHADMLRQRRPVAAPAQHGIPLGNGMRTDHQERIRFRHYLRADQQQARPTVTRASVGHQDGLPSAVGATVRQQQMIPLPLGWWQIAVPPPPVPPEVVPFAPPGLRFCRLADGTTALVFGCPATEPEQPGATIIVPARRTYIVLNSISLVRVSDGLPIPATSLALDLSKDSWTWGFTASLSPDAFALVLPNSNNDPVELLATVNGVAVRLVVENVTRQRQFGAVSVNVSGRGRSAFLSDPYAPGKTFSNAGAARTAQQLMQDVLTINGVSIGWGVDWGLTDWLVPAGAWSHTGNYMSALNAIAAAAGGYVLPHPTEQTVRIRHSFPVKPWEIQSATPDIELPTDVVQRDAIGWKDNPAHNRVFVTGTTAGVVGQVTRAGTAGDNVAPTVADPLITHADAARQRGIAILGGAGRIATEQIRLPVLPETGIIEPGKVLRYVDGGESRVGITRGVSVEATLFETWQNVELETYA